MMIGLESLCIGANEDNVVAWCFLTRTLLMITAILRVYLQQLTISLGLIT